jgi:uncharacterized membrane protein YfcA
LELYLPVANMSVGAGGILSLGLGVGLLSGLFGVGGGFIGVPLLIFLGVPPAVAVASQSAQITGSSLASFIAYAKRGEVDDKMAITLSGGGLLGSLVGVLLLYVLRRHGHSETVISLLFIFFIGLIGLLMLFESSRALVKSKIAKTLHIADPWKVPTAPFPVYFPESRLNMSLLVPMGAGMGSGILMSLMGVGGGFFLIPIMLYVFGMSSRLVIGTCALAMLITSAISAFLHGAISQTLDPVLALMLLVGGLFGAQLGVRASAKLPNLISRLLMALLLISVATALFYHLAHKPDELFTLIPL